jgi:hypothetical protein
MPGWVYILVIVIVIAIASRPIESRLWRAGRISDRTLAVLIIGRFPVLSAVFAVLSGASGTFLVLFTIVGAVPGLLMYRFVLNSIKRAASARRSN